MPKKLAALGICALYLVALFALLITTTTGNLDRLVDGEPLDWAALRSAVEPSDAWRFAAIPVLLLLAWDAYTLLGRRFENANHPPPSEDPLGYARFRGRRYALVPVSVATVVAIDRFSQREVALTAIVAFWVTFLLARRPMNATFGTVWTNMMEALAAFLKGAAGNR